MKLLVTPRHGEHIYFIQVKENLMAAIKKDAFVGMECKLVPPEALAVGTVEEEERKVFYHSLEQNGASHQ